MFDIGLMDRRDITFPLMQGSLVRYWISQKLILLPTIFLGGLSLDQERRFISSPYAPTLVAP